MKLKDENKQKAVITTSYVVAKKSPIVSVYYDEDGDWQFFGEEEVGEEDARVVSIKQILDVDNSLITLPNLTKGQSAFRVNSNSVWQIRN